MEIRSELAWWLTPSESSSGMKLLILAFGGFGQNPSWGIAKAGVGLAFLPLAEATRVSIGGVTPVPTYFGFAWTGVAPAKRAKEGNI